MHNSIMNFNGGSTVDNNFQDGGDTYVPPSGTLTINQNLQVLNDLEVLGTIVSNIEVKDAIVSINRDSINDVNNTGIYANNTLNTMYSGLVRSGIDKKFYLFNNSTTLPSALGIIADRNGTLLCGDVNSSSASFGAVANQYTMPPTTAGKNANDVFIYDGAGNVSIGRSSNLYSADGLQNLTMGNAFSLFNDNGIPRLSVIAGGSVSLGSFDANSAVLLDNSQFYYETASGKRLELSGVASFIRSPNINNTITIGDGGFNVELNGWYSIVADAGSQTAYIQSPDNTTLVEIGNGTVNFRVNLVDNRIYADITESKIRSPDTTAIVKTTNGQIELIADGVNDSLLITPSQTFMSDSTQNSYLELNGTSFFLDASNTDRLRADASKTEMLTPDGATLITMTNADTKITKAGLDRVIVDATGTTIVSPSATSYETITTATAQTVVGGIARIQHNASNSFILSPDGTKSLTLTNTNLTSNCPVVASSTLQSVGVLTLGTGGTSYAFPTTRGTVGQSLQTDGSGTLTFKENVAWSQSFGGNVSSAVLRYLIINATNVTASDTALTYANECIAPFASTLRFFAWSSLSSTGTTVMSLYVNGVSAGTIALSGTQGRVSTSIAVASGARVAVAWNPTGGGIRPDNITCTCFFA